MISEYLKKIKNSEVSIFCGAPESFTAFKNKIIKILNTKIKDNPSFLFVAERKILSNRGKAL